MCVHGYSSHKLNTDFSIYQNENKISFKQKIRLEIHKLYFCSAAFSTKCIFRSHCFLIKLNNTFLYENA